MKKETIFFIAIFIIGWILGSFFIEYIGDRALEEKSLLIEKRTETKAEYYTSDLTFSQILRTSAWISENYYDYETYNCMDISKDLKEALANIGIKAELISGTSDGTGHMWIGIWIESQSGNFINPSENYIAGERLY